MTRSARFLRPLVVTWRLPLLAALLGLGFAPWQAARANGAFTQMEQYCHDTGGLVQILQPEYNTNGGTPLVLSPKAGFCEYRNKTDGTSIYLLLTTLTTKQPTLAALAYYGQTPYSGTCSGSPGSCYCSQLGGTDLFGGINAAGGGWVNPNHPNYVEDVCMFPDRSAIDSYGLFYHSAGIIRGIDLSTVLRYPNPNTAARR